MADPPPGNSTHLHAVPDGEPLRVLDNGLVIIRRRKHEPTPDLLDLPPDQLRRRTDKRWGSKFSPDWHWPLPELVDWIEHQLIDHADHFTPGQRQQIDLVETQAIGFVAGRPTRTIRIVSDGRYVHAYPVGDA